MTRDAFIASVRQRCAARKEAYDPYTDNSRYAAGPNTAIGDFTYGPEIPSAIKNIRKPPKPPFMGPPRATAYQRAATWAAKRNGIIKQPVLAMGKVGKFAKKAGPWVLAGDTLLDYGMHGYRTRNTPGYSGKMQYLGTDDMEAKENDLRRLGLGFMSEPTALYMQSARKNFNDFGDSLASSYNDMTDGWSKGDYWTAALGALGLALSPLDATMRGVKTLSDTAMGTYNKFDKYVLAPNREGTAEYAYREKHKSDTARLERLRATAMADPSNLQAKANYERAQFRLGTPADTEEQKERNRWMGDYRYYKTMNPGKDALSQREYEMYDKVNRYGGPEISKESIKEYAKQYGTKPEDRQII